MPALSAAPVPFDPSFPREAIERIQRRLVDAVLPPALETEADAPFAHGISPAVMARALGYWRTQYDWGAAEAELKRYPHFRAEVDGQPIHFVHVVGEAGGRRPVLMTHGWPGSVYEFWEAIPRLTEPSRFGGRAEDAVDLVLPSLPGYGWSPAPQALTGPRAVAALFDALMREGLGYERYLAQGGDWGAMVTSWLGFDYGAALEGPGGCAAIHLNMIGLRPTPARPQTEEETAWIAHMKAMAATEMAYFQLQANKPQTLAHAVSGNPQGWGAWLFEKFESWADTSRGGLEAVFGWDRLITNAMTYLANGTEGSSLWMYRAFMAEGGPDLPEGARCETPTAFANYPGETVYRAPPRSWAERAYNITRWTEMERGGHFAAMEEPELFSRDVAEWAAEAW